MTTTLTASKTHRTTLNTKQLQILHLLYKFRFGTSDLLALQQHVSRQYLNVRLGLLVEREYIGRNFDTSYRLSHKPATYYLLPKGIRLLKDQPDINPTVLRLIAKDKHASERFIGHSLGVFNTYCQLKQHYDSTLKFFTKSYLKSPTFEYFPQPLSDGYLLLKGKDPKYHLLESFEASLPFFVIKNRIKYLLDYADSGEWPSQHPLPGILLVCETEKLRQRVEAYTRQALEDSWVIEALIATATPKDVARDAWRKIDQQRKVFNLSALALMRL